MSCSGGRRWVPRQGWLPPRPLPSALPSAAQWQPCSPTLEFMASRCSSGKTVHLIGAACAGHGVGGVRASIAHSE